MEIKWYDFKDLNLDRQADRKKAIDLIENEWELIGYWGYVKQQSRLAGVDRYKDLHVWPLAKLKDSVPHLQGAVIFARFTRGEGF